MRNNQKQNNIHNIVNKAGLYAFMHEDDTFKFSYTSP